MERLPPSHWQRIVKTTKLQSRWWIWINLNNAKSMNCEEKFKSWVYAVMKMCCLFIEALCTIASCALSRRSWQQVSTWTLISIFLLFLTSVPTHIWFKLCRCYNFSITSLLICWHLICRLMPRRFAKIQKRSRGARHCMYHSTISTRTLLSTQEQPCPSWC